MAFRGVSAPAIARCAGLTIVRVADRGVVRQDGPVLEIGTGASDDAVATVGCRRLLAMIGVRDEELVQRLVEGSGYGYVPEEWGVAYQAAN